MQRRRVTFSVAAVAAAVGMAMTGLAQAAEQPPGTALPGAGTESSKLTVSGVLSAGVEPGCRILRSAGVTYLLVTADPGARVGVTNQDGTTTVTGLLEPDRITRCQQGIPLVVEQTA